MTDPRITLPAATVPCLFTAYVKTPSTALYDNDGLEKGLQTELLYGQGFRVYKQGETWLWGQAISLIPESGRPAYIGFVAKASLTDAQITPTHSVSVLRALVFSETTIKSPILAALPLNAQIQSIASDEGEKGEFIEIKGGGYIHHKHLRTLSSYPSHGDFVALAESQMGVPYVWGGTGMIGLDCSGLVQMSLCAIGQDCPRDADMQEASLGRESQDRLKRGDLVFWPGHVGILSDPDTLLHANAFHMKTEKEPFEKAKARIGDPRSIKRL